MLQIRLSAASREELIKAVQYVGEQFNIAEKSIKKQPKQGFYKAYLLGDFPPVLGSDTSRKTPLNTDF